jgi:predicted O-methyltransferase YrrM
VASGTEVKLFTNWLLRRFGLQIDTLTREKIEAARIEELRRRGYFERPAFPLLPGFADFTVDDIVAAAQEFSTALAVLMRGGAKPGGYDPGNDFYKSPDAQILYLMVRSLRPRRIVEVGSGNSTRIIRQAIADGALQVEHVAIDPEPRSDVAGMVDRMILTRFEYADVHRYLSQLSARDILFIDSSHEVHVGNDVARLFCAALPTLADGVVVHVHDIFLPFEYPDPYYVRNPRWGEQYLLQLFLQDARHEVLWPGYYLQKEKPEITERLPFLAEGIAQSLWFRLRLA